VTRVLGVDGCPGGWVGALVEDERVAWHRFADMDAAFELGAEVIGLDMPVGLPDHARRECDVAPRAQDPRGRRRATHAWSRCIPSSAWLSWAVPGHWSRRTAAGRAARVTVLQAWLPDLGDLPAGDDGLDALAVAWSAQRWLDGRARTRPGHPPYDRHGRPMRIVT
jgi:predicted RNase H-like nuclease